MASITGIPTTRISSSFIQQRLLSQLQSTQNDLFRLQTRLSTGRRYETPSEDPISAMQVIDIQRLIERKQQIYSNVETSGSYLNATDVALSNVSSMIADIRGTALSVLGTTATDDQRRSAAQQVDQVIQQLLDTANQKFRGRYLFAGSTTDVCPFCLTDSGSVEYLGNRQSIQSYSDLNTLLSTNLSGDDAFGAIASAGTGDADLNPVVTFNTRLDDLAGGRGISAGSISISDGNSTTIVDLSAAATLGDVAQLLKANPPEGNSLAIELTSQGFRLRLAAGNLTINEVGGGTVAQELGILEKNGVGTDFVYSRDLDPILRATTSLDDIFGTRARAVVRSEGADNDIIVRAAAAGENYNGFSISFADTAVAAGSETVDCDEQAKTLVIGIKAGESTAADVAAALNAAYRDGNCPFTAEVDRLDDVDGGMGPVELAATATTEFGDGRDFDKASGLRIVSDRNTYDISFEDAETVEDMLNIINGAGAGLLAEINAAADGININSRISGADFTIGENGGSTATDLGLRTLTAEVSLDELNFGYGIDKCEGTDFTITRGDGVVLEIDLDTARTIQDVLDLINDNPQNGDHFLVARLATYGNGIELVDGSRGGGTLSVTRAALSTAAIDLGLIAEGEESAIAGTPSASASAILNLDGDDNDLEFSARFAGSYGNVAIVFEDTAVGADSCSYNADAGTLTFEITAGVTSANDIIALLEGNAEADALFAAGLSFADEPSNTGDGPVPATTVEITGGQDAVLSGVDCNPQETEGLFTALLRLRDALQENDVLEVQRAVDLLDSSVGELNFARAELGTRMQSLETLQSRLEIEEAELNETLSLEYDADLSQVVTELAARQVAYEAALKAMGSISQLSLLNYI